MKAFVAVTPEDTANGFALTGVPQVVATPESLPDALGTIATDPVGVIVVDERLLTDRGRTAIRAIERRWPGVIVVLPAPAAEAHAEDDYIRHLIRSAIGYQVRVNL